MTGPAPAAAVEPGPVRPALPPPPDAQSVPVEQAVADAVLACPAVVRLSGGVVGEIASYLPGKRLLGVRLADGEATVHVVARYGPTVAEIAQQVRQAVRGVTGPLPVTVGVDDLELVTPENTTPQD
ncbi:MAG: hypothetical protein JWM48_1071 [Mycobacterium sp.]|nr:hypothetical protein [Mycobacterium sp.]